MNALALIHRERDRTADLGRAQSDLYWLATEKLGYDKLTPTFHKPMMDEMDRERRRRGQIRRGILPRGTCGRDMLDLWAREHFKTTVRISQAAQDILCDPNVTIIFCHAVDDEACRTVQELANHFLKNKRFRALRPEIMPPENDKRFYAAGAFTLKNRRFDRAATVRAVGVNTTIRGLHVDIAYLDDIITLQTILDSQMGRTKRWVQSEVRSVVKADGWINASGTRLSVDDIYSEWLLSPYWTCRVRAALETDGRPDYFGQPTVMTMEQIEKKKGVMGPDFSTEMMNDPSPSGEKPWRADKCEHVISRKDAEGPGLVVILSDPAPATVGDIASSPRRENREKNAWAIAAVKLQRHEGKSRYILLDGEQSRDWPPSVGWRRMMDLAKKYGASHFAIEKTGQATAFYESDFLDAAREVKIRAVSIDLSMTYQGKNHQFGVLADRAAEEMFLICESVRPSFLEPFLDQARNWRPMGTAHGGLSGSRNALAFDDCANVVSFCVDPALRRYLPVTITQNWLAEELENRRSDYNQMTHGGRYVQW